MIELAALAEKGSLPVSGGTLEQAAVFLTACRFVWSEQDRIRAEAVRRDA